MSFTTVQSHKCPAGNSHNQIKLCSTVFDNWLGGFWFVLLVCLCFLDVF